jgi:hypothetical protein
LLSNSGSHNTYLRGQLEVDFKYVDDDGEKSAAGTPAAAPPPLNSNQESNNDEGKNDYLLLKRNLYESLISLVHNDQCRTSNECIDE